MTSHSSNIFSNTSKGSSARSREWGSLSDIRFRTEGLILDVYLSNVETGARERRGEFQGLAQESLNANARPLTSKGSQEPFYIIRVVAHHPMARRARVSKRAATTHNNFKQAKINPSAHPNRRRLR